MPKAPKAKVGQNKKPVHPNSRRAQKISRKVFRDIRISQGKSVRTKFDLLADKITWFRDNIDEEKKSFNKSDICELTSLYLRRFEEELEQIDIASNIGARRGNQHASRVSAIKLTMESEKNEVTSCGVEVPDLVNKYTLDAVRTWDGDMKYLQNFKLKKIKQEDIDKMIDSKDDDEMEASLVEGDSELDD